MLEVIKNNVIRPLAERLGTMAGVALAPFGVHATTAEMFTIGLISVGFIALDLSADWMRRNRP